MLRRDFSFLGESGAYYFLWGVAEPVPAHEEWRATTGGARSPDRPRRSGPVGTTGPDRRSRRSQPAIAAGLV